MIQRYGIRLGRLWVRWPYFEPRDLWVGAFVKERFWETHRGLQQGIYICLVPTLVLYVEWTVRGSEKVA